MDQSQQQQVNVGVLYNAAGQAVVFTLPSQPSTYDLYRTQQSLIAGVTLIVAGVLSIIFNIIGIEREEVWCYVAHGIWCGAMFVIAGAFGVSAVRKNRCLIIAFLVLAIISAFMAAVMFSLSVVGAVVGESTYDDEVGVMSALMAVMAVIAGSVSIWGSVLGCKVCCCKSKTATVVNSAQPIVVFSDQQQQLQQQPSIYHSGVDPVAAGGISDAPPKYTSLGYPGVMNKQQQQQQHLTGPMPGGYFSSPT